MITNLLTGFRAIAPSISLPGFDEILDILICNHTYVYNAEKQLETTKEPIYSYEP